MKIYIILLFVIVSLNLFSQDSNSINKVYYSTIYENDKLPSSFFKDRRKVFRENMPDNSIAFIFAAPIRNRSNDVNFEYHQNPNLYYLTGYEEPNSVLLITKTENQIAGYKTNEILFVQARDESKEIWDGRRLGVDGAKLILEISTAINTSEFENVDLKLEKYTSIHVDKTEDNFIYDDLDKEDLFSLLEELYNRTSKLEDKIIDEKQIKSWLANMREIKTDEELILLRKAIDITCLGITESMRYIEPNMKEYESEAVIEYIFKKNGAEYPGFPSILGSGENSCILHYVSNRKTMSGNSLIVSDVGAEYHGYTADVTRTLPVDGEFSKEEAIIYNIVLNAQKAGIEQCKVGNRFWDPNIAATTVISQELKKLGIIKKPIDIRNYFMHGTSHYLGLDVHDKGTYGRLRAGSVITVEPGIYIAEGSLCDPKWWNIGIRIEDDILITDDQPEVLSDCVPRTIKEIESIMSEKSYLNEK